MLNPNQMAPQSYRPSNNGGPQNAQQIARSPRQPLLPRESLPPRSVVEPDTDDPGNPETPYPYFLLPMLGIREKHLKRLPRRIHPLLALAGSDAQADALFLTLLSLLPFTVSKQLRFRYNGVDFHASPMVLFCAPPAAGKGLIGELFHLLDIEDERRRKIYQDQMKLYRQKMDERANAGKKRAEMEFPEMPKLFAAKIAGDNSASGLLENIYEAGGSAALVATEINELAESTQRKGCGDPTTHLCKVWNHEDLFMNRRTEHENILIKEPILTVVLTGTPSQLKVLIRNPGNGFFTRAIYYHIPIVRSWQYVEIDTRERVEREDMTPQDLRSNKELILDFAREWEALLHKSFDSVSDVRMLLTDSQLEDFNARMDILNNRANGNSDDMLSFVHRLGCNVLRLCLSLALLRALDPEYAEFHLLTPRKGTNADNIKDGITPLLDLHLLDSDYYMMMDMMEPLYVHGLHTLSLLDKDPTVSRHDADREVLLSDLPEVFTYDMAYHLGRGYTPVIKERTIRDWVKALVSEGKVEKTGRSSFEKISN